MIFKRKPKSREATADYAVSLCKGILSEYKLNPCVVMGEFGPVPAVIDPETETVYRLDE